jgi:hypothetical protein
MDEHSKQQWTDLSHEHAKECLEKISAGEADGAFEFAQIFLSRIPQKDTEIFLLAVEALARQSAVLGCAEAKTFLENEWGELKPVLEKRLNREFGAKP